MTKTPRRFAASPTPGAAEGLIEIYRDLDAEISQLTWTCRACATCCRFADLGHELYITTIEADHLVEGAEIPVAITPEVCPFLIDGKCSRRERRTICCRTYYCCVNGEGLMEALTERYLARLKELHLRLGIPWHYASLSTHLNERNMRAGKE